MQWKYNKILHERQYFTTLGARNRSSPAIIMWWQNPIRNIIWYFTPGPLQRIEAAFQLGIRSQGTVWHGFSNQDTETPIIEILHEIMWNTWENEHSNSFNG